ncbi:ApeP family dehydratase [Kangiella sediminilitoris]|uniref:Beta-hydroxyacyl-(Acyl-carrier-protein) dehydratase FabA/FabZ n=1 Tax=Kangiella sediminilitoris TaxID=1144748 RepID=A0A1B3BDT7_9GAMM|nr:hotdog family protein [Kangiella sediminilitoris]AOE50986.1 Beta-hydroxyacyl-(Acyl-carrier-protein) dehydratase FabA/FabZ [Kangiella sediminilitoris]
MLDNHNDKLNILSIPLRDLVPHSEPMVLLDSIVEFNDNSLLAEFNVTENSRFYDASCQGIESWVGIEYMAQAIAALAGIRAKLSGEEVKLGFLLGTRKMNISVPILAVGNRYQVYIEELYMDDSGLGAFNCTIRHNDSVVSDAKLNVFETSDSSQLKP